MKIKFVRHGETDLNSPIRRMQGVSNYDLNNKGIKQAQKLREELKKEQFDLIISSPLIRALHTANIINEDRNIPLIIDNRIKERNYGKLEGECFNTEYCNLNYDFTSVGGETIDNYKTWLKDFINDVQIKYNDKKVLVVCHNGVISVLSCILEGEPNDGNFENRGIKNGQIKEFIL